MRTFWPYAGEIVRRTIVPAERGETAFSLGAGIVAVASSALATESAVGSFFALLVWALFLACIVTPWRIWREDRARIASLETPKLAFTNFGREHFQGQDRWRYWVEISNTSAVTVENPRLLCRVFDYHGTPIISDILRPLRQYADTHLPMTRVDQLDGGEPLRFTTVTLFSDGVTVDLDFSGSGSNPDDAGPRPSFDPQCFWVELVARASNSPAVREVLYLENFVGPNAIFERCGDVDIATHKPKTMYVGQPNAQLDEEASVAT